MFRAKFVSIPELEGREQVQWKMELYEATVEGRWWKAKSILKNHEDAAAEEISENGNTMLHLAIQMGHRGFVERLLMNLENGPVVEKKNADGRTALHVAAMVDNFYAAQLLVQKREQLLLILDNNGQSPLDIAYNNIKLNTYAFFLTLAPSYHISHYPGDYTKNAVKLIVASIAMQQYDTALILLQKYPELAMENDQILTTMAKTFPTDLNPLQSLFYPSLINVRQRILVRVSIATFYPLYELICLLFLVLRLPLSVLYFHMWKVLAVLGPSIKYIEQKKKMYKEAFKILSLICDQMGTSTSCYNGPILEAVRQDAYEVVEDIDLEDVDLEDFELQGTAQEKRSVWVDDRAHETLAKYEGYLVEKYGKEDSQHPKFDQDLWYQAVGGKNRGKVYGLSNISHQYLHGRQDHEIEKLNAIIQDVVKEKEEEKERLNGIIAELVMEKEKDKAEKEAMNKRMANIEAMFKVRFQNV